MPNGFKRALDAEPRPNALTRYTARENPASLLVLARAEKRLTAMIARRGIDDEVLAVAGTYDRMYRSAHAGWSHIPTPAELLEPTEADRLALPLAVGRVGGLPTEVA